MRVLHNVSKGFLNKVQIEFKKKDVNWFKEDQNGDVDMSQIAMDENGKYIINYDKAIGRLDNLPPEEKGNTIATLEAVFGYSKVITNPSQNVKVKDKKDIVWPNI